ncbi:probable RNA-binding protein 46 [Photinus pyralis]|uniref:probable RNA-binding protein 46 n=1 Tax=Photinus pyralis TaxID=7054 RepID=UPI0012674779|nr:probable RNA-binding protein 46 [Photinus pyralis]
MATLPPLKHSKATAESKRYQALLEFMENNNLQIVQFNGQRVTTPRNINMAAPERGSEIFIGKIPRSIFEDELIPLFGHAGVIIKFRLMLDFCGLNRGYGFVTYASAGDADRAVAMMDRYEIRHNRHIGVYKSIDNRRLFMGHVPVDKTKQEIYRVLNEYVDGITNIIMYPAQILGDVNRGYVFIEFADHKAAAMARRQLRSGLALWDSEIAVDWADPIPEVSEEIMSQVKKLYVRNLPLYYNEAIIRISLSKIIDASSIVKIHKIKDYAFIHFDDRQTAEFAMNMLKLSSILGEEVEVDWARPARFSKFQRMNAPAPNFCTSVPPRMRRIVQECRKSMSRESTVRSTGSDTTVEGSRAYDGTFELSNAERLIDIDTALLSAHVTN